MKIIDLLNKMAKGEELPKTIRVSEKTFNLMSDRTYKYVCGNFFESDLFTWLELEGDCSPLNDPVEIIEEDKKIEKLEKPTIDEHLYCNGEDLYKEDMKIIDLLNKIANGEEVPKKILLNGSVFEYQGDDYLYNDEDKKEHWLFSASYADKYMWLENFLKARLEIIEEDKKIEKINTTLDDYDLPSKNEFNIIDKINELIDEINKFKGEK